jgi:hypothetical protein
MIRLEILLALTISCGSAFSQSPGAGSPPIPVMPSTRLKLEGEIKPATVKLGEPINIKFHLANLSSTPIGVGSE